MFDSDLFIDHFDLPLSCGYERHGSVATCCCNICGLTPNLEPVPRGDRRVAGGTTHHTRGQRYYSALAITTALTLRAVFHLALRQTEGLIGSVITLLGLELTVPDHSTMCRRSRTLVLPRLRRSETGPLHLLVDSTGLKLGGAGEWLISTAHLVVGPGVSCISALMPEAVKLSRSN
jgi:hypothetical protein